MSEKINREKSIQNYRRALLKMEESLHIVLHALPRKNISFHHHIPLKISF
jgi:hypothetical protein